MVADTFAIYREENYLLDFNRRFRYVALHVEMAGTNRKEYWQPIPLIRGLL
jgi:hypothetical protein